jgi:hypothetical protein
MQKKSSQVAPIYDQYHTPKIRNSYDPNILANSLFFDGFLHVLNFELRSLAFICDLEFGAWNFHSSISKTEWSDSTLPLILTPESLIHSDHSAFRLYPSAFHP